jgi:transposase
MGSGTRERRTMAEKRRIVELTLAPGASLARIAQAEGVNANQIFQWRRAYRSGSLEACSEGSTALLPVVVPDQEESVAGELSAEAGSPPASPICGTAFTGSARRYRPCSANSPIPVTCLCFAAGAGIVFHDASSFRSLAAGASCSGDIEGL